MVPENAEHLWSREPEERFDLLVENVREYAICLIDPRDPESGTFEWPTESQILDQSTEPSTERRRAGICSIAPSLIMETNMTEAILKIRAEELTTIRLVFANKVVHEMPIDDVRDYAGEFHDEQLQGHLLALGQAVRFFASKKTDPSVEFVVPGQQPRIEPSQPASTFARH